MLGSTGGHLPEQNVTSMQGYGPCRAIRTIGVRGICLSPGLKLMTFTHAQMGPISLHLSEQQALHLDVPAPDPTAILRDMGYLGPSFASLETGWGSGPHVGWP